MKKLLVLSILIFSSFLMFAQSAKVDENSFSSVRKSNMEIAVAIQNFSINGQNVTMLGGYGGRHITKNIFLGGGGFGLANNTAVTINNQNQFLKFAYGGFILGYDQVSFEIFKYRIYTLIGGGTIDYDEHTFNNLLFVNQIGMAGELRIVENFSVSFGLGYRLVQGANIVGISDSNLSTIYWDINFKLLGF